MQKAEFSVDAGAVLREVAQHFQQGNDGDSPGLIMGCDEIRKGLVRIANRALALEDAELIAELSRLGVLKPA